MGSDSDPDKRSTSSQSNESESNNSDISITSDFSDDIAMLHGFSLIAIETGGASYEMYRLVQFAIRIWLDQKSMSRTWIKEALRRPSKSMGDMSRNSEDFRTLSPHVSAIVMHMAVMRSQLSERDRWKWCVTMFEAADTCGEILVHSLVARLQAYARIAA